MIASDELPAGWSMRRQGGAIVVESSTGANDGTFDYVTAYAKSPSIENRVLWRLADVVLGGKTATAPNPLAQALELEQSRLALERGRTDKLLALLAVVRPAVVFYTQHAAASMEEGRAAAALENFDRVVATRGK